MKALRITLILGLFLILTTTVVSADSPPNIGPAWFGDHPSCMIFDVNFVWYYIEDCSPTIVLHTNSATDERLWFARAQLPDCAALPEREAVHFTYENSGFSCWGEGILTTNYSITITPKGKFIINCHFRPDKWQPLPTE